MSVATREFVWSDDAAAVAIGAGKLTDRICVFFRSVTRGTMAPGDSWGFTSPMKKKRGSILRISLDVSFAPIAKEEASEKFSP